MPKTPVQSMVPLTNSSCISGVVSLFLRTPASGPRKFSQQLGNQPGDRSGKGKRGFRGGNDELALELCGDWWPACWMLWPAARVLDTQKTPAGLERLFAVSLACCGKGGWRVATPVGWPLYWQLGW